MRNLTKALTVVSLLAPVSGYTLGIGDIRVRSALNQKLNAEISLVVSPNENPNSIKVNLAPPERFDSAGVSWSYFLSKIRFKPIVKPNGSVVVKVTSTEALKEPYLNFLLEVSWPKGNLYREFTVLVDPPSDYQAPSYQPEPRYEPSYTQEQQSFTPKPRRAYDRPERPVAVKRAPRPRAHVPVNPAGNFGGQTTARRNDTLWRVAARAKGGSDVSVEQMMMALYDQNPDAFYERNVNALSAGKTLHVPTKNVVQQMTRQQAVAEFARHNQAWANHSPVPEAPETQIAKDQPVENQLKLEAPVESSVSGNEKVSPSSSQAANNTPPVAPETSGQQSDGGATPKASTPAVDDAVQAKLDALQKQLETMQQIIALKDKQLADLQTASQPPQAQGSTPPVAQPQPVQPPVDQKPVEQPQQTPPPPATTKTPQPGETTEAVKPIPVAPKPEIKPPVLTPEPVAKESDSSYLGLIGGTVLAFMGILGWIWWRKQKMLAEIDAESMFGNYSMMRDNDNLDQQSSFGKARPASPAATAAGAGAGMLAEESSFLNDFKASDFESFETFNVDHGDIDPVAEADVYLAYGRYQQAEDLMRDAVKNSPDRDECKLKLLEIYQISGNAEAFEAYAKNLAAAGKNKERDFWDKVIEMSKDVSSDSELFANDHTPAVFPTAAEAVTENVLVSQSRDTEITPEAVAPAVVGVAQFTADDSADEESTFASSLYQEHLAAKTPEPAPVEPPSDFSEQETQASPDAENDDLTMFDDNESIDFNLGPYPDAQTNKFADSATDGAKNPFVTETTSYAPSDNEMAKGELSAYEFDIDFEKPNPGNTKDAPKPQQLDSWDPNQTIDFSFDTAENTAKASADTESATLDFNFDVEIPSSGMESSSQGKGSYNVADLTDMDEVETKLDLAKAYIDMGDSDSAKDIISQVIAKGNDEQKEMAKQLLQEIG